MSEMFQVDVNGDGVDDVVSVEEYADSALYPDMLRTQHETNMAIIKNI